MLTIWSFLIVSLASLLKGLTGFGFALVSLPLLMIWYSPKELIPILMMCNLLASVFNVLQKKDKALVSREFWSLILFGGIFTILGVITLKNLPEHHLIRYLGIFFVVLTLLSLFGKNIQIPSNKVVYKIAGSMVGFLMGSVSVGGPPLALFLNAANVSNRTFREIFSWFNIITATVAIVGYAKLGMIDKNALLVTAAFVPILLLGSIIGKRLNQILPSSVFKQFSLWMTLAVSIYLLVR